MTMQTATYELELKAVGDATDGSFEGYAAVFNNVDRGGDIIEPGAFDKTLSSSKGVVPVLWMHSDPIGVGKTAASDARGLAVTGQIFGDMPSAAEKLTWMRNAKAAGLKVGMSIGYRTVKDEWDPKTGVRTLKQVDLIEYSIVPVPMNPKAGLTRVKSDWTEREFEELLREHGFSQAAAKTIVAKGFKSLIGDQRDVDTDALQPLAQWLREQKAAEELRSLLAR